MHMGMLESDGDEGDGHGDVGESRRFLSHFPGSLEGQPFDVSELI